MGAARLLYTGLPKRTYQRLPQGRGPVATGVITKARCTGVYTRSSRSRRQASTWRHQTAVFVEPTPTKVSRRVRAMGVNEPHDARH